MTATAVTDSSTTRNPEVQVLIDGRPIPWRELFGQLQLFGKLRSFVQDIASQRLLMEEVASRSDLEVDPVELDQAMLEFREKRNLLSEETLQTWLKQEHIDYQGFRSRLYFSLKLRKLKQRIAEPDLQQEFESRSSSFEQVELSYLISASYEPLATWHELLQSGATTFHNLSAQEAANEDLKIKAPAAPVRRSWLPKELQEVLLSAEPLEIHGPLAIGEQWIVFRLERVISPCLDERLERQLTDELFGRWLREKLSGLHIQLSESGQEAILQP